MKYIITIIESTNKLITVYAITYRLQKYHFILSNCANKTKTKKKYIRMRN